MKTQKNKTEKDQKKQQGLAGFQVTGMLLIDLGFLLHCASRFDTNLCKGEKKK